MTRTRAIVHTQPMARVIVLGAGVVGLTCAVRLLEAGAWSQGLYLDALSCSLWILVAFLGSGSARVQDLFTYVPTAVYVGTGSAVLLAVLHFLWARRRPLQDLLDQIGAIPADPKDKFHAAFRPPCFAPFDPRFQNASERVRDFSLNGHGVGAAAIEGLCPEVIAILDADQLRGDPVTAFFMADAAFEHRLHLEITAELTDVDELAFVLVHRRSPGDVQARLASELGGDLFRDAVGEPFEIAVFVALERDRFSVGEHD